MLIIRRINRWIDGLIIGNDVPFLVCYNKSTYNTGGKGFKYDTY